MSGAYPPYRTRMSCEPPPPPSIQLHAPYHRPATSKRPKHAPPRRPPRPVVKQKGGVEYVDSSTSMCDDAGPPPGSNTCHTRVNVATEIGTKAKVNGVDRVVTKPPICRRPTAKPVPTPVPPVTVNHRRKDVSSACTGSTTMLAKDSRQRRPSSTNFTGHGDVSPSLSMATRSQSPFQAADLPSNHSGSTSHLNTLRLRKGSLDDDILSRGKPIVQYVRISKKPDTTDTGYQLTSLDKNQSKSVDELDRYNIFLDLSKISCDNFYNQAFRSSFVEEATLKRQTLGFHSDVQTLLKHSSKDTEHIYSLPQPQSYSEDTLKAVRLITDKYDTLQRRRLHAASFREGDLAKLKGTLTLHREMSAKHPSSSETSPSKCSSSSSPVLSVDTVDQTPPEDIVCNVSGLVKKDVTRLEMFYRGLETEVVVCTCLADLYLGNSAVSGGPVDWLMYHRGVPVWVLNTGNGPRRRELHIYLAERQTGFPLWQDKVNYLTNLEVVPEQPGVMTMRLSGSLSKMVRFCVKCEDAATTFFEKFWELTADPNDELWRVSSDKDGEKLAKRRKKKKKKRKPFTKHDISQPCNFLHVSTVDAGHLRSIMTVQQMIQSRKERETLAKRVTLTSEVNTAVVFSDSSVGSASGS